MAREQWHSAAAAASDSCCRRRWTRFDDGAPWVEAVHEHLSRRFVAARCEPRMVAVVHRA